MDATARGGICSCPGPSRCGANRLPCSVLLPSPRAYEPPLRRPLSPTVEAARSGVKVSPVDRSACTSSQMSRTKKSNVIVVTMIPIGSKFGVMMAAPSRRVRKPRLVAPARDFFLSSIAERKSGWGQEASRSGQESIKRMRPAQDRARCVRRRSSRPRGDSRHRVR